MYDIAFLCQAAHISQQTFYRLVRDNDNFKSIVESNREKFSNSYRYNESVLKWLCEYYNIPISSISSSEVQESEEEKDNNLSLLLNQIEDLKSEIAALKSTLEEKESERKQLFSANQNLLLLLSQEKAEKQMLLHREPTEQKIEQTTDHKTEQEKSHTQTLGERIKNLFKR